MFSKDPVNFTHIDCSHRTYKSQMENKFKGKKIVKYIISENNIKPKAGKKAWHWMNVIEYGTNHLFLLSGLIGEMQLWIPTYTSLPSVG